MRDVVVFELLERVPTRGVELIEAKAERLTDWLDGTVVMPRFATPLEKRLRSRKGR